MKKKNEIRRCECPKESIGYVPERWFLEEELSGRIHKPNKCKGTYNIKKYKRGKKELYLCSCCHLIGDIEIEE